MKYQKLVVAAMAALMLTVSSTSVVLASDTTQTEKDKKGPTEEEKQQWKERMNQAISKWESLSEEQKQEVYQLYDSQREMMNQIMDKYVELGIMNKEDAAKFKQHMEEQAKSMKENGKLPLERPQRPKGNKAN